MAGVMAKNDYTAIFVPFGIKIARQKMDFLLFA
jgi:hypothetical protein